MKIQFETAMIHHHEDQKLPDEIIKKIRIDCLIESIKELTTNLNLQIITFCPNILL